MKYLETEPSRGASTTLAYCLPERNGRHFPNGNYPQSPGDTLTRPRASFANDRTVVLPRHVAARALETPSLNGLVPLAAGRCSNVLHQLGGPIGSDNQTLLIYCSRGRGWCEMRGHRHDVNAGELLVIPHGVPHSYGADSERLWAVSWAQVAGLNLAFLLHQLGASIEHPVITALNDRSTDTIFQDLLNIMSDGHTPSHLLRAAQTLSQLFEAAGEHPQSPSLGEADAAQKIRQSITFMKQHLDRPLQVSVLAAQANVSQSHYFAIFKRLTGFTPIDYFIHLRMKQASHLLKTSSASVKEVAGALGYDDPFYFSRVFRSVHGIAPSEYRLVSRDSVTPSVRQETNPDLRLNSVTAPRTSKSPCLSQEDYP